MLKLTNIVKSYLAGSTKVEALKGISIEFRKNEFVSVLGQSGCGKTTLLNIIGGLDQYDSGDMSINNRSTKNFKDKDWDSYRNHSIGFVFQSYNLIPHQTVLSNVELALTLSGVSKSERRRRAEEALAKVGLSDQLNKRPNQMSGGQMQRVAIARALVNDPEILLADEPTGALDSETSVQIMEILKEISKDKLIIMVTHNPELAEKYSTRIVKLLDGEIINDSDPYDSEYILEAPEKKKALNKKGGKMSMSFLTALSLSLNNLMTKKARTFMTSFAGSIGIIGIALIMALSNGINLYINRVQEDTLSSYPIQIAAETVDMSSLVTNLMGSNDKKTNHELDAVYSNSIMYELINTMNSAEVETNNLKKFKEFIEKDESIKKYISAVQYSYDLDLSIYTKDSNNKIVKSDVSELLSGIYGAESSMMNTGYQQAFAKMNVWTEILSNQDGKGINELTKSQYDCIYGEWPKNYNEVVLIVDKNNEISDLCLYALGLKTSDELTEVFASAMKQEQLDTKETKYSYKDICSKTFKLIPTSTCYQISEDGTNKDLRESDAGLKFVYDSGIDIKISGIVRPNEEALSSSMSGSIGYTRDLTTRIVEIAEKSDIVKKQMESPDTDIFTGLPFKVEGTSQSSVTDKANAFKAYAESLSIADRAELYTSMMSEPNDDYVKSQVDAAIGQMTVEQLRQMLTQAYAQQMGSNTDDVADYINKMDDKTVMEYAEEAIGEQAREKYSAEKREYYGAMTATALNELLGHALPNFTEEELAHFYDVLMPETASVTYEDAMKKLGFVDLSSPTAINIYASSFDNKDSIAKEITKYNEKQKTEDDKIDYTDYVQLMMSSITTIINAISYVLIAFVAISLIVSSIMIGIITYISVLERTKEIGILRSIGASKSDISRVFNAETLIIGFAAGVIGIVITVLLCIPITAVVRALTDINNISAALPFGGAIVLVIISMLLTFFAGLIPSGVAAKKDPVEALRTE
ncbi:MAG: ABC transporter ATP-binding protein/permease [Clostridia bacterium]|nr:ABC transporter ATP-binding protein/permease [Clostridia bacterium]